MNWLVSEAVAKIKIQLSEPVINPALIPMKLSASRRRLRNDHRQGIGPQRGDLIRPMIDLSSPPSLSGRDGEADENHAYGPVPYGLGWGDPANDPNASDRTRKIATTAKRATPTIMLSEMISKIEHCCRMFRLRESPSPSRSSSPWRPRRTSGCDPYRRADCRCQRIRLKDFAS